MSTNFDARFPRLQELVTAFLIETGSRLENKLERSGPQPGRDGLERQDRRTVTDVPRIGTRRGRDFEGEMAWK